ncbi:hypothetical protein EMIT0P43_10528 [Pseudomonas jessenii]
MPRIVEGLSYCTLWRGGLPPFERKAVAKQLPQTYLDKSGVRVQGCFAAQRGQAPSPQMPGQMREANNA